MKLRLQSNSIRFRLKRSEVEQLATTHRIEEAIVTGSGPGNTFRYVLEASQEVAAPQAQLEPYGVRVQLPVEAVTRWASGPDVGIEADVPAGDQQLRILIEKDFACLTASEEENTDTFPHPLAGTAC